ncbi:MAG: hypothetical protein JWQ76_381 [Ramlibacter sp.]|nr:hypothetical protein [Ramlibacter sp.]
MNQRIASQAARVPNLLALVCLIGAGLTGSIAVSPTVPNTLAQRQHGGTVQTAQAALAAITAAGPAPLVVAQAAASSFKFKVDGSFDQLRDKLRWLPVRFGGSELKTPDAQSRLLLAQSAAQRADLAEVGLSYRDVYGIINAETSWIPRMGASKDGTPNLGIAQFEPATAKAMGIVNPADPVEAVHAAALHMRDAAVWSAHRIAGLKLTPEQQASKLREGVSIYYNLSSKGRNAWNGRNTAKLPFETRRHIANARLGAREAAELEEQLAELKGRMSGSGVMTASYTTRTTR